MAPKFYEELWTIDEAKEALRKYVNDEFGDEWGYMTEAGRYFGVSRQVMEKCLKDKYDYWPKENMLKEVNLLREKNVCSRKDKNKNVYGR